MTQAGTVLFLFVFGTKT